MPDNQPGPKDNSRGPADNSNESGKPELDETPRMKRVVGLWNSFAMGYADVGADIYVAIGLIIFYTLGASPLAFLIAAITYATTGLSYAELASTYPIAGGAQFYSLKAFGSLHGFVAGWGLMLDYTIDIALFSLVTVSYLGSFFLLSVHNSFLVEQPYYVIVAIVIIIALVVVNLIGIKYSSGMNLVFTLINLVTMAIILIVGLPVIFASGSIERWLMSLTHLGTVPTWNAFIFGTSLAMVSYIGIESISQAAEETKYPKRVIPLATKLAIVSVVSLSVLLSLLTVNLLASTEYKLHSGDAIVAVAQHLSPYLTPLFAFWVAFVGFAICYVSTNTGVIGVSRVTFSMARLKLFPHGLSRLSRRFLTPYVTILLFPAVAILIIVLVSFVGAQTASNILTDVAQLYNFGALIAYMYVNLSLIILRTKDPTPRAWRVPGSIWIPYHEKKYEIPIIPVIGFISCFIVWLIIVGLHPLGRELGVIWFAVGIAFYVIYRRKNRLPILNDKHASTTDASSLGGSK